MIDVACRRLCFVFLVAGCASWHAATAVANAPLKSVSQVHAALSDGEISASDVAEITAFIRTKYPQTDLSQGAHRQLVENTADGGGVALWALQAPRDAKVKVHAEKQREWPMQRLGDSDLWVATAKFPNFTSVHYRYEVNGVRLSLGKDNRFGFESYEWLPESQVQPGVPTGELIDMGIHTAAAFFPGTTRKWWVYVPQQYDASVPTRWMVFNDGAGFCKGDGNACTVFDNLIHQQKIPPVIAIFIDPGELPPARAGGEPISNRGNEYDTCTRRYADFLEAEILPLVSARYNLSKAASDHAICGSSSGGSCAFTAAWHRNDLFGRVVTFVGSYCDFRRVDDYPLADGSRPNGEFGPWKTAHDYPGLIRKTEPRRNIRIFLQDGENDLDNQLGNWFLNNERMAAALDYAGYEYRFVAGKGMHSKKHGMSILPEILVWLWQD